MYNPQNPQFYIGQKIFCETHNSWATVIRMESKEKVIILLHSNSERITVFTHEIEK